MKGKVLWFDTKKGYGFIADINNPEESYFVHYTQIITDDNFKKLSEGDIVSFELGQAPNGKQCAVNVTRA